MRSSQGGRPIGRSLTPWRVSLMDARVIFEHDPDNHDTGSTRTVEAMPLFGSRPVLEGLYMESAISSAFIYQLQAEISNRPSSPLSRFPSSKGTIDAAIGHMNELYTDTLVLRSEQMKQRFSADERFEVLSREDPFLVLRLKNPESRLVDIVDGPVEIKSRERWMDSAFRRFRLSHPYATREIYLSPDQEWQAPAPATGGDIRILEYGPGATGIRNLRCRSATSHSNELPSKMEERDRRACFSHRTRLYAGHSRTVPCGVALRRGHGRPCGCRADARSVSLFLCGCWFFRSCRRVRSSRKVRR